MEELETAPLTYKVRLPEESDVHIMLYQKSSDQVIGVEAVTHVSEKEAVTPDTPPAGFQVESFKLKYGVTKGGVIGAKP